MGIYPIRNEADHRRALQRIEKLMDADVLSAAQGAELDALVTLVDAYEARQFPIKDASPIQVIKFLMDQRGLVRKDLEPMLGSRARVSEILSGKRPLTLAMIRTISQAWNISADLLIGQEKTTRRSVSRRSGSGQPKSRGKQAARSAGGAGRKVMAA